MSSTPNILIKKLDRFIRKYYINMIIKGLMLTLAIAGLYVLVISFAEYFGRFSVIARTALFYGSIAIFILAFWVFILVPVFRLLKIGKRISYSQAAYILGRYFPSEVGDKLQNTLELSELAEDESDVKDLIIASIAKRTEMLSPVSFISAINLKKNLKYFKLLAPVMIIFVLILLLWPTVLSEGTERLVNYSEEFTSPPPFSIHLNTDSLTVRKGEDFTINMKTQGDIAPDEMKIVFASNSFYMEKVSAREFKYTFRNLNNPISLHAESGDISSPIFEINVLPAPVILDFTIDVDAPAYTGVADKQYSNTGDLSFPYGSKIEWRFNTDNINAVNMLIYDSLSLPAMRTGKSFSIRKQILRSSSYQIQVENEYFSDKDKLTYNLNVIPDLYPAISVEFIQDSTNLSIYYFSGIIDDDYGFTNLAFNYKPDSDTDSVHSLPISISKNVNAQTFYFAYDFSELASFNKVSYYFEVGDNDGINGSKKTRTKIFEYVLPSLDDIADRTEDTMESIDSKIEEAQNLTREIRDDIEDMQQKLINEEMSDWDRQQMMQQIAEKQEKLDDVLRSITNEQKELNDYKNSSQKQQEDIIKKQKEIQDLLENLMDEELRKLMEELKELMKNFDEEKFNQLAKEMEMSYEDLSKQMDQDLELLKRMEVEERMQNAIDKLEELSKEQEELAKDSKEKSADNQEIKEEQEELGKEISKLKEDYEKTLNKNEQLNDPYQMEQYDEAFDDLEQNMEESEQQLENGKMKKASKKQEESAQQMMEMSKGMQQMLDAGQQEMMEENMSDLKQIIENLLEFSFAQEDILNELNDINSRNPLYRELNSQQKKITDDFKIINDSLDALATRMTEISAIVREELSKVNIKLSDILEAFSGTAGYTIRTDQQLVMTSANNLALLLSEIMEAMQQQMSGEMSGDQNCQKCQNGKKGKMGKMRDMQQGLKQQMQQMINQMKQNGGQSGSGKGPNAKDVAQMIAQQEMLQQMMNDMMNSGGLSPESAKILSEINRMMEQNMKDLVNGNITPETINRQEMILTRMLEVEKSDHERELDDKRKSNEAREKKLSNPEEAFKEKEKDIRMNELLQMSNLRFTHYYKTKYKDYLRSLSNKN